MSLRDRDRIRELERRAAETQAALGRLPVREARSKIVFGPTMLKGTAQSFVADTDDTFTLVVGEVIFGAEDAATVTVKNSFDEEFNPGDKLTVFKREADGDYEPDRAAAGTGSSIIYYELTQDMALADTAKLAKPVTPAGVLDAAADAFYVVDPLQQFYGRAAFTDALATQAGYRGFAHKFTDDYNSTGIPGWRIIAQEGPMMLLAVTLGEDGQASGTTTALPLDADAQEQYGNPFRGRYPAADSGTGAFECHDDFGVIEFAKQGDKWLAIFDEKGGYYNFLHAIVGARFSRIRGKIAATVSRSDSTLTLNNVEAVEGANPTALLADTITVTIPPNAKMDIPNGTTDWIYAKWNEQVGTDETDSWDSGDEANHYWVMRGHVGFSSSLFRVLTVKGNTEADLKWLSIVDVLKELTDYNAANAQSVLKDAAGDPKWKDDGTC